jgi:hypothetical protein
MIESLYIVDSAGICLLFSPLMQVQTLNPDLTGGFIMAQQDGFRQTLGEAPRRLTLEKREFLIQRVESKKKNLLIAIAYGLRKEKEERYARTVLETLADRLKKSRFFERYTEGAAKVPDEELEEAVADTLKSIPCPLLVRGLLGITNHCQRIDAPITDNRSCDFNYAVNKCQHYANTAPGEVDVRGDP